ncbi:unnamed protein product [Symbiodinium sp. CCMP2592]|nr:unnamed protein product [Symbiodinium sp. CCMP2592]
MQGYTFLWRSEELWQVLQRTQKFHNWFSKLHDQQASQLSEAWKVRVAVHFIRREDYRGQQTSVLCLSFRRDAADYALMIEQLQAYLTACAELLEYCLYLRSFPALAAGLLARDADEKSRGCILDEAKKEWSAVQELEASTAGQQLLRQSAVHTTFQSYREVMCTMEGSGFKWTPSVEEVVRAWHPPFGQSANLEQVFQQMEQSIRKSGVPPDGRLGGLSCVAIRAFLRRVCNDEDTPSTPTLEDGDWEGKQVRALKHRIWNPAAATPCRSVKLEEVLKPFPSTSAYHLTHHGLNCMLAWKKVCEWPDFMWYRKELCPVDAASSFWVASCMPAGTMFRVASKFYLSISRTAAVVHAICLAELPYVFQGTLPEAATHDEDSTTWIKQASVPMMDPFAFESDDSKALVFSYGSKMFDAFHFSSSEVQIYRYTLHVLEPSLEAKLPGFVFRREPGGACLLLFLFRNGGILDVSSDALSELLALEGMRLPKNATKSAKIRKLMTASIVAQNTDESLRSSIEDRLKARDEANKKRKKMERVKTTVKRWDDSHEFDPTDVDPACAAAQELLNALDKEDEEAELMAVTGLQLLGDMHLSRLHPRTHEPIQHVTLTLLFCAKVIHAKEAEQPAEQEAEHPAEEETAEAKESRLRASRALLTKSSAVPEFLTSKFPIPAWGLIHHTISKDGSSPLFQAKLGGKEIFEGKSLD